MEVSIIFVNSDDGISVRRCLRSILRNSQGCMFEVLVVDCSTTKRCRDLLLSEFPNLRYIVGGIGSTYAAANNLGAKHAIAPFMFFLSPETELIENSIKILLAGLRSIPGAGAVSCQLQDRSGRILSNGIKAFPTVLNQILDSEYLRERFPESDLWGMRALHVRGPRLLQVEVIPRACLLIRRSSFDRVRGFNEGYAMFCDDTDLCWKLHATGTPVYYLPETRIVHLPALLAVDASDTQRILMLREATLRFMYLNRGAGLAFSYRAAMAISAATRLTLMGPMMLLGTRVVRHGIASWQKWFVILRWALGVTSSRHMSISSCSPLRTQTSHFTV